MGIPCITVLRFCGRRQHLASAKDTDKRAVDAAICCTIVAVIVLVAEKTGLNGRLQSRREKKTPPFSSRTCTNRTPFPPAMAGRIIMFDGVRQTCLHGECTNYQTDRARH